MADINFDSLDVYNNSIITDVSDSVWNKMQTVATLRGSSLPQISGGGSIMIDISPLLNGAYISSGTVSLTVREKTAREDPLKFSKAQYHGYIKNLRTKEIRKFQFNPAEFEYSRSVSYSDSISPGMAYPETQFCHGEAREFNIELFMYDPYCTGLIKEYMNFLGGFLTPEVNEPWYTKPPEMLFYYGYFIRRCVLTNLNIVNEWLDEQGTPLMSRFQLTLRQVGVDELE